MGNKLKNLCFSSIRSLDLFHNQHKPCCTLEIWLEHYFILLSSELKRISQCQPGCDGFFKFKKSWLLIYPSLSKLMSKVVFLTCYLNITWFCSFDGFTSTFQDKLFRGYDMEIHNQIFYTTLCSCMLSFIGNWKFWLDIPCSQAFALPSEYPRLIWKAEITFQHCIS